MYIIDIIYTENKNKVNNKKYKNIDKKVIKILKLKIKEKIKKEESKR